MGPGRPLAERAGGIAAGSPYAPYELAVHLVGLVDIIRRWSIHVDDVSVMLEGPDRAALVDAAGRLARALEVHISAIGMRLDLGDKAFALASDGALVKRLQRELGELGGCAVESVRKLGVDYAL